VLTYKVLHGSAPWYLGPLVPVANLPGRRTLRSSGTSRLIVPSVRRSTVGDRAFSVAGPRVWNTLPEEITTSQSLLTFRQQLKTWLFGKSYPDIIMWTRICLNFTINLEVVLLLRQFLIDWLIDWLTTPKTSKTPHNRVAYNLTCCRPTIKNCGLKLLWKDFRGLKKVGDLA